MILFIFACLDAPIRPLDFTVEYARSPDVVEVDGGTLQIASASLDVSDLHLQTAPADVAWSGWSLFPTAHAHPGHSFAGDVRGELIGNWQLDLLDDQMLGTAEGYEAAITTGSVLLDESRLQLTGTFERDGQALPVDLDLVVSGVVTNIPIDLQLDADLTPARLVLSFDLAHALSQTSFVDADGDGTFRVEDGPTLNTLTFGLVSTSTWILQETP